MIVTFEIPIGMPNLMANLTWQLPLVWVESLYIFLNPDDFLLYRIDTKSFSELLSNNFIIMDYYGRDRHS